MNTQAAHTPGPWKYCVVTEKIWTLDGETDVGTICGGPELHEWEHNGRLMAAAPDLLHAARLANEELSALGVGSSGSPALRALWWAIARAEGKEP